MLTNVLLYSAFTVPCVQQDSRLRAGSCTRNCWTLSFTALQYFTRKKKKKEEVCSLGVNCLQLNLVRCSFFNINDVQHHRSATAARAKHQGVQGIQRAHLHPELCIPCLPGLGLIRAGISTLLNSV